MFYTIYKTTNLLDGKIYIGKHQTTNLDDDYIGSGKHLHNAIKKHGVENFTKEILFIFKTEVEMNEKEAELVTEEFCLREDTYNLCPGGKGGWGYVNQSGNPWRKGFTGSKKHKDHLKTWHMYRTKQSFEKISNALKGKRPTYKWLGKFHSNESKLKMSDSHKGSSNSQYGLQWITNGVESTRIKKDDPIPEGWKKGRKIYK